MSWSFALNLSFGLFGLAFIGESLYFLLGHAFWRRAGILSLVTGWLTLTVGIFLRWQAADRVPLSNQYESLIFLLWAVLGIYFLALSLSYEALDRLNLWVSGFALVFLGAASLLNKTIEPLVPALQSNWLLIHVTTTLLGYASLALAFLGGLLYLTLRKPENQDYNRETLEPFLYRSLVLGFWLLTLGIATGAIWANSAWGTYWSWDPKETWSLITWIYYAMAIHLRRTRGWKGSRFAWLAVAGFAFVVFTYFGVNYLLSGLHAYA